MCGLCGVFGWIGQTEKEALMHLQIFSQLRGIDSTGVAVVPLSSKDDAEVFTALGGLENLVYTHPKVFKDVNWLLDKYGLRCIISHRRRATVGKITEENIHPFDVNNIIG